MNQWKSSSKQQVILPIGVPLIETYPTETNMLAMFANNDSALAWFVETYFQLFTNNRFKHSTYIDFWAPLPWEQCEFLKVISTPFVEKTTLQEVLIEAINKNYYIFIALNHKQLLENYLNDFIHETLVYGYSIEEQVFFVSDFFEDKYQFIKVSFEQMCKAYENENTNLVRNDAFNKVYFLQPQSHNYKINAQIYKEQIENYLNSKVSIKQGLPYRQYYFDHPEQHIFGVDLYDFLTNKLYTYIQSDLKQHVDFRGFHMLYSHKLISQFSLSVLTRGYLVPYEREVCEQINNLVDKTLRLRNMILKFDINRNPNLLRRAICTLEEIKSEDCKYFQTICRYL